MVLGAWHFMVNTRVYYTPYVLIDRPRDGMSIHKFLILGAYYAAERYFLLRWTIDMRYKREHGHSIRGKSYTRDILTLKRPKTVS